MGDELPGNAKLRSVHANRVVIERGGKLENLFFPEEKNRSGMTIASDNQDEPQRSAPEPQIPTSTQAPSPAADEQRREEIRRRLNNSGNGCETTVTEAANGHCRSYARVPCIAVTGTCAGDSLGRCPRAQQPPDELRAAGVRYRAFERLENWQRLHKLAANAPVERQLELVNRFFNRVKFVSDIRHWGEEDYWATPVELLTTNAGDCEDFSIAKYLTLKSMGVPDDQLRVVYVKALELNQAHMFWPGTRNPMPIR